MMWAATLTDAEHESVNATHICMFRNLTNILEFRKNECNKLPRESKQGKNLAAQPGLEPGTNRLTVDYSTIELLGNNVWPIWMAPTGRVY